MTAQPLRHVDANDPGFRTSLKEAVVEGVVRRAHDRLTGRGDLGRIVMNDPPTKMYAAGFLLPAVRRSPNSDGDVVEVEITSPIHIATLGMSFQVARSVPGTLDVKPAGSVYVRILPDVADLSKDGVTFGLKKDLRADLRKQKSALIQKRLQDAGLPNRGGTEEQRQLVDAIRSEAHQQAFRSLARENAISPELVEEARQDAMPSIDPVAAAAALAASDAGGAMAPEEEATIADAGEMELGIPAPDEDHSSVFWTTRPEQTGPLPDDRLVEPVEFTQKWCRVEVEWPSMVFDPSWDIERIRATCREHEEAMQRALTDRLAAWVKAPDRPGEPGGQLWAMPQASNQRQTHKVTPRQVAAWNDHLTLLRATGGSRVVPTLKLQIEVRVSDDPLDEELRTVRIMLANRSTQVDHSRVPDKLQDRTVYLAALKVTASPGLHRDHVLGRIRPSYRWNKWLEHAGLGINCGLDCERLPGGSVVLRTNQMPQWRQPRIAPHDISPKPTFELLSANDGGIEVARTLVREYECWIEKTISDEPWRVVTGAAATFDEAREKRAFEEDVVEWRKELDGIRRGLHVLEECVAAIAAGTRSTDISVAPLRAWRATNAAFLRVQRGAEHRGKFAPSSWRLFQLAFLLSHLPGVVSRIPEWSDRADLFADPNPSTGLTGMQDDDATASLLYFPTGGGKSEAFFGLIVLQVFVDRIRGKLRGVSAIVRYPLRLLTTQQANRFARVFAMAELERRAVAIPGDPFQIGFWVGGGNTPNYPAAKDGFNDLPKWETANLEAGQEQHLRKDDAKYQAVGKWRRLTECPFCGGQDVALRRRGEGRSGKDERLAHVCVSKTCDWNVAHDGPEPLPFHVMDTDIYAYAPTVLLGTVDKMAAIAQNPNTIAQVFGMFGFAPWMSQNVDTSGKALPGHGRLKHPRKPKSRGGNPTGDTWCDPAHSDCIPIGPVYGNNQIELFDPLPAIEVQDEAHLLEQSLGTFSGLFGSMLETAFADLSPLLGRALTSRLSNGRPRRAKVIAASATVQAPERQIEMLYQRHVRMFPRPGPDLYQSFFARLDEPDAADMGRAENPDVEVRTPTRRLYVSMPTNGRPHTSATVAVLSALHLTLTESYGWTASSDEMQRTRARAVLSEALPLGPLRDIHRHAIDTSSDDRLAEALDLARILLCYVTSKKGGDSVQAALSEFVPRDHARAGVRLGTSDGVETGLITGSVEIDAIQKVVQQASPAWKPNQVVNVEADFLGALRGIVATSAISHGVDIERLNMMVFAGLPSDIAEYVQASSRVGRTHVGASILVPIPQRVRDVHVVGIHDVFHRFLERMVQPAAIDRWGENAIDRVVASAVQIRSCAVEHFRRLCEAPDDAAKRGFWDSSGVNRMRIGIVNHRVAATREMEHFLKRAIGMENGADPGHDATKLSFGPIENAWYDELVRRKVGIVFDAMRGETYAASFLRTFWSDIGRPPPMTSLRDVDEAGVLVGVRKSISDNRPMPRDMGALMRRLRQGNGAWSEGEGDSDTAVEDGS